MTELLSPQAIAGLIAKADQYRKPEFLFQVPSKRIGILMPANPERFDTRLRKVIDWVYQDDIRANLTTIFIRKSERQDYSFDVRAITSKDSFDEIVRHFMYGDREVHRDPYPSELIDVEQFTLIGGSDSIRDLLRTAPSHLQNGMSGLQGKVSFIELDTASLGDGDRSRAEIGLAHQVLADPIDIIAEIDAIS